VPRTASSVRRTRRGASAKTIAASQATTTIAAAALAASYATSTLSTAALAATAT
jgi:hypothetical protein